MQTNYHESIQNSTPPLQMQGKMHTTTTGSGSGSRVPIVAACFLKKQFSIS